MADDATTTQQAAAPAPEPSSRPAAPAAGSAPTAPAPPASAEPIEPTPSQADSKGFRAQIDQEIEDLWAQAEGRAPATEPEPEPEPVEATAEPEPAGPEPAKAEETPAADDPAALRVKAYEEAKAKIEAEERARQEAEARVRQESEFQQAVSRWVGSREDRQALTDALEAANLGDTRLLDGLDVTLPNGKKVSELRGGQKGLTTDEAQNLLIAWRNADAFGDTLADRKVKQIIGLWTQSVNSSKVLDDPDVDADAVRAQAQPDGQMAALKESVRDRVTARLAEAHQAELAERDKTIKEQAERIKSLTDERANLQAAARGANLASPDRPGQPGAPRRGLPTPDEFARMPATDPRTFEIAAQLLAGIGR